MDERAEACHAFFEQLSDDPDFPVVLPTRHELVALVEWLDQERSGWDANIWENELRMLSLDLGWELIMPAVVHLYPHRLKAGFKSEPLPPKEMSR